MAQPMHDLTRAEIRDQHGVAADPANKGCTGRGFVVALEPSTGKVAWKYDVGPEAKEFDTPVIIQTAFGERVFHQKFGYGRVVAVEGNKLLVDFEKAGSKRVMDGFWEFVDKNGIDPNPYRAGFLQLVAVSETDEQAEAVAEFGRRAWRSVRSAR